MSTRERGNDQHGGGLWTSQERVALLARLLNEGEGVARLQNASPAEEATAPRRQWPWALQCLGAAAACGVATLCWSSGLPGSAWFVVPFCLFAGSAYMAVSILEFDFLVGREIVAVMALFAVLQWAVIWYLGRRRLMRGRAVRYRALLVWLGVWWLLSIPDAILCWGSP